MSKSLIELTFVKDPLFEPGVVIKEENDCLCVSFGESNPARIKDFLVDRVYEDGISAILRYSRHLINFAVRLLFGVFN